MITRKKSGKKFVYFQDHKKISDKNKIERLNKLAIPPAWKDVKISASPSAKVQATGRDAAGRQQTIYHSTFRLKQEKLKYERILRFSQALPKIRRQIEKDLSRKKLTKEKVLACIVKLIDMEFFRVGNDVYAKEHESYGITTLRSKHANVTTTSVTFDFVGKSGQKHVKKISDTQIARVVKQVDELPGHEIFKYLDEEGNIHDVKSADVNAYIKQHMGEDFTAKDFRTWGGTLLATSAILEEELQEQASETVRKKTIAKIVKQVAKRLGNTPAIARSSYIDPRVFVAFEDGVTLNKLRKSMKKMKPRKYLTVEEQCVLKLLSSK